MSTIETLYNEMKGAESRLSEAEQADRDNPCKVRYYHSHAVSVAFWEACNAIVAWKVAQEQEQAS